MRIYYEFENTNVKVSCDIIHTSNRFAHHVAQEYYPLLKFAEGSQMRIYYEFENTNVKVSCDIIHISNRFAHHSARIQLFLYS
jgi:hypothetical protein